jgi:CheY-like chemotaxis protein
MMAQNGVTRKRILLADDQREVRETIKLLLDLDEHIVTEAGNGVEALNLFAPGRFDLVITDYAMPQMRGDELAGSIKRLAPAQPILMITGSAEKFFGIEDSVDALLNKPFNFEELREAVNRLLGCPGTQLCPAAAFSAAVANAVGYPEEPSPGSIPVPDCMHLGA